MPTRRYRMLGKIPDALSARQLQRTLACRLAVSTDQLLGREKRPINRLDAGTVRKCAEAAESFLSRERSRVDRVESSTVVGRYSKALEFTRDRDQLVGREHDSGACGELTLKFNCERAITIAA